MFIELHNVKQPDSNDDYTIIGVSNQNGNIHVAESYDRVKELIDNATRK